MIARAVAKRTPSFWAGVSFFALAAVTVALRAYRLGDWPLADDEIFTLRDSRTMDALRGAKPLLFFLHYHLIGPARLGEFSMRVLPALFGILSVPVAFLIVRRLANVRAALVVALLIAVHPEHVYWSQFARYHSLLFLLASAYPFAFFWGVTERRPMWIVTGFVTAALAGLAHPSAVLPLAGVGLWALYHYWGSQKRAEGFAPRLLWPIAALGVAVVAAVVYFLPILLEWFSLPETLGFGSLGIHLSHLNAMTPGIVVTATFGTVWLLRDASSRSLGVLLALTVVVPAVFLSVVAQFASAYTGYLWPTAPAFFIAATLFIERCLAHGGQTAGARFATTALVALLVLAPAPILQGHYRNGSRHDFRSAADHVRLGASPGDIVFADQLELTLHYLGGADDLTLHGFSRDPDQLSDALASVGPGELGDNVWIIASYSRRGGFGDLDLEDASSWVHENCRESAFFGNSRLDYKLDETRVHRCPARGRPRPASPAE